MIREEKSAAIADLKEKFSNYPFFYVTDSSALTVEKINQLRRKCFESEITVVVVKNTLAIKALQDAPADKNYAAIFEAFKGPSTIMFTNTANAPARLIEEFRKHNAKPLVKGAYIDTAVFLGDEQLETLAKLKSKEELVGEIIGLLQSPARNVISALQSSGQKIAGIVKTLEERAA